MINLLSTDSHLYPVRFVLLLGFGNFEMVSRVIILEPFIIECQNRRESLTRLCICAIVFFTIVLNNQE